MDLGIDVVAEYQKLLNTRASICRELVIRLRGLADEYNHADSQTIRDHSDIEASELTYDYRHSIRRLHKLMDRLSKAGVSDSKIHKIIEDAGYELDE